MGFYYKANLMFLSFVTCLFLIIGLTTITLKLNTLLELQEQITQCKAE